MSAPGYDLVQSLRNAGYPAFADVADEVLHPRRGFKGFPGHRTLCEQRDLMTGVLRALLYEHCRGEHYRGAEPNPGVAALLSPQDTETPE